MHFTDPDMSEEFANRDQPCGRLVRQWVGKTVSNWPEGHPPTARADGWTVGVTAHPQLGTLQLLANKHREEYSEFYFIWSVEPAKQ